MRSFAEAVTTFPVVFFTAGALVVLGFWLLVAVDAVGAGCFDEDVDAEALGLGGVHVAVSFSLLAALAWSGSVGAVLLVEPVVPGGTPHALTGLAVFLTAPAAAWCATRMLLRPLRRRLPEEPGPPRTTA